MRAFNPVRRGQLIAPFGVAALMVLKGGDKRNRGRA